MKKNLMLVLLNVLGITQSFGGWNQSTERWEQECNDYYIHCDILGSMYEDGDMIKWNGKYNEEYIVKKNFNKALKAYKKGCVLGKDAQSCEHYKRLTKKLGKKTSLSITNNNYKISHKGKNKIYTIVGHKSCRIIFNKNKQIIKNNCTKLTNSKGIKIYCIKSKKVCKTHQEIINSIN